MDNHKLDKQGVYTGKIGDQTQPIMQEFKTEPNTNFMITAETGEGRGSHVKNPLTTDEKQTLQEQKSYCYNCNANVEFHIAESIINNDIKGIAFEYQAKIVYCNVCGEEIYISELSDENVRVAHKKYIELKELAEQDKANKCGRLIK